MSRPRKVELNEVRARALEAFWENGFDATSLSKLEEATQVGRRSLLNAYGDKYSLFTHVIEDFKKYAAKHYLSSMEKDGAGLDAIKETFSKFSQDIRGENGSKGCMICNTAREPIARTPEIHEVIWDYYGRIENSFHNALLGAQAKSEISSDKDVASLAKFFFGVVISICTLSRAGAKPEQVDAIIHESLKRLD